MLARERPNTRLGLRRRLVLYYALLEFAPCDLTINCTELSAVLKGVHHPLNTILGVAVN